MSKKLLIGNEAVARGLYEGGLRVASSIQVRQAQK